MLLKPKQIDITGATDAHRLTVDTATGRAVWAALPATVYPQYWKDALTADGGETGIDLGQVPLTNSLLVWKRTAAGVDALLDEGTDYTLTSRFITDLAAMAADEQIRTYYAFAEDLTGVAAEWTLLIGAGSYGLPPYGTPPYGS